MRNRVLGLGALAMLGLFSMGANGGSCTASYSPGDGSADAWQTGPVPTPSGAPEPMSCAWLDGENCWTPLYEAAATCAAKSKGTFSDDRRSCTFPTGEVLEFDAPIPKNPPNDTLFPLVQYRLLDDQGNPCVTGKILGIAKGLVDVQGTAVKFEATSILTYSITCPDGSVFDDSITGTCQDTGARWLAHTLPGHTLTCDGDTGDCTLQLSGPGGAEVMAVCGS